MLLQAIVVSSIERMTLKSNHATHWFVRAQHATAARRPRKTSRSGFLLGVGIVPPRYIGLATA
jgi:hypothetical protein